MDNNENVKRLHKSQRRVERRMSSELHVAMISHKRIPSREGGVEIVVDELSTRLVARGHRVTAYNRTGHHVSGKVFNGDSHHRGLVKNSTNKKEKVYKDVRVINVPTINSMGIVALISPIVEVGFCLKKVS